MKIDIHAHTKKCKQGDAATREVSANDFCEIVLGTDIGIIAITNHNRFDLTQFNQIQERLDGKVQVWPGIELDIDDNGNRGHLLIIVSPTSVVDFSDKIFNLCNHISPDFFTITIEEIVQQLDTLNPLYIAHYKQKLPSLSDSAIAKLKEKTQNPHCVIKEVTNSISAGIYISHGHPSIYGSDIQDWATYEEKSEELPDLRLPVESFEHFSLLLKKDQTTINTALNKKIQEELTLSPFDDDSILRFKSFNDINIIFGPKGTGKSCILKAIENHYTTKGYHAQVYESASDKLDDLFDTKGANLRVNLEAHNISEHIEEIEFLRHATERFVTPISNYKAHFLGKCTSKKAREILLKNIEPENIGQFSHEFNKLNEAVSSIRKFLTFLQGSDAVKQTLREEEFSTVTNILTNLHNQMQEKEWVSFSDWKETCLLNSAIETYRHQVEKKTGTPAKPITTGFRDYALNRFRIEKKAKLITDCLGTTIKNQVETVGSLGTEKGLLEFITELKFQDGNITDGTLKSLLGIQKGHQKNFAKCIQNILDNAYTENLFTHLSVLKQEEFESISKLSHLLLFKRYFAINGTAYSPSSGESSMVMLLNELSKNKDIYILDEPERSLGNEYINDEIVPLLKQHAKAGKKVFISTHDANIAVRTLPYNSVFRLHDHTGYKTFIGNPFTSNLTNVVDHSDQIDWKQISMKTLEGGEAAFGERGKIYGKI